MTTICIKQTVGPPHTHTLWGWYWLPNPASKMDGDTKTHFAGGQTPVKQETTFVLQLEQKSGHHN